MNGMYEWTVKYQQRQCKVADWFHLRIHNLRLVNGRHMKLHNLRLLNNR